jgi:hypothetical protein
MTYLVTTELKTSKWKKLLRFFRLIKQREEFKLTFYSDHFKAGDILIRSYYDPKILILKKI